MKRKYLTTAIAALALAGPAVAEEPQPIPEVIVEGVRATDPVTVITTPEAIEPGIAADSGELLRAISGVSGNRMGGHAVDPIIRGQSQTQLNILLDGSYLHGGCPNRMDPPTSYAAPDTYDEVTVIKGSQTVIYGGGGSGGTVLFERITPRFAADDAVRGKIGAGYKGNSSTREGFADVATGTPDGYARMILEGKEADNYTDGRGDEVRSAYKQKSGNLLLGYTPDANTRLELGLEAIRGEDVLFAGAGMDAPISDTDNVRLQFNRDNMDGALSGLKMELYQSDVYHLMDSYSLRPWATKFSKTPSDSLTFGGRLMGTLAKTQTSKVQLGIDHQHNDRDAIAYMVMPTGDVESAYLWPDVSIVQSGVFAEFHTGLTGSNRLKAGLRHDQVSATAAKVDQKPGTKPTPNQIYQTVYGYTAEDKTENNTGGFLRLERDLANRPVMVYASVSRSVRTADATERYMAKAEMDWVGNPEIEPEKHHQLDVGMSRTGKTWSFNTSLYYTQVDDFILRDTRVGPDPTKTYYIYSNVGAMLAGLETEIGQRWSQRWSSRYALAYVQASNTTDNEPLPQIPALEGSIYLDYKSETWKFGGRVRMVDTQDRVNLESGLDEGETAGYTVVNLYGSVALTKQASVDFGVDNVFNRIYAEHVNRANVDPFAPDAIQVNEPGRAAWLKAKYSF